jgi:hypothetical protein
MKKKVYVACALTHASPEFKEEVEMLKKKLENICTVLHFKGLSDSNLPRDVYIHDIIDCVHRCDILVAICDHPSIGLGYEMATQAESRKKPILAVAHEDSKVTKLILDPFVEDYSFRRYNNLCEDVYEMVLEMVS